MSYILYSSIARAGGIDLLLSMESYSHQPNHPYRRRKTGPGRLARLRRHGGQALIAFGGAMIRWGKRWAPPAAATPANGALTLVAE